MKLSQILNIGGAAACFALAASAHAGASYSQVFAFGDSLSDAGDYSIYASNPANHLPAQPVAPYVDGIWSNGPTWAMDLSSKVGSGALTASLSGGTDFAYSGSVTGTTSLSTASFRDLPAQLSQFEAANPGGAPGSALYTVESGINDAIGSVNRIEQGRMTDATAVTVMSQAAADETAFVSALYGDGARNVLIYLSPDLGTTPDFNTSSYSSLATTLTSDFNADLSTDLAALSDPGLKLYTLNVFALQDAAIADPAAYGFADATDPCWTGSATSSTSGTLCATTTASQDKYLFWDVVHPTAAWSADVAKDAYEALSAPEPAAWMMMLLGLGAVGGRMRWRRLQRHGACAIR
jgi:phospholipase/lecithinase/hemolysin